MTVPKLNGSGQLMHPAATNRATAIDLTDTNDLEPPQNANSNVLSRPSPSNNPTGLNAVDTDKPNDLAVPSNTRSNGAIAPESPKSSTWTALEQLARTLATPAKSDGGPASITPSFENGPPPKPVEEENKGSDSEDSDIEEDDIVVDEDQVQKRVIKAGLRKIGRRGQTLMFDEWVSKKADILFETVLPDDRDQVDDEHKSSRELLRYTTKKIISDPREYQLELYERAKQKNIIAVLDTGSGKTLIATLLIRNVLDEEAERRAQGKEPRICVFLVANVTLVFQQAAVLDCNLDTTIGRYCGEMGVDLWSKRQWDQVFLKDRVIVATADTIFNCLTHAFLNMRQINMLIFDECHHAKKHHVYARIMRDFYNCTPEDERPRVFGMTASPVDARVDVTKAASGLEAHLHSEICTASDLSLLQRVIQMPFEEALIYPKLHPEFATDLVKKLVDFKNAACLQPIFRFSKTAASELGSWCADEVWKFGLTEIELSKLERKLDIKSNSGAKPEDPGKLEKDIQMIRAARAIVAQHEFSTPKMKDLSPKVILLLRYLMESYKKADSDMKCIVFVTRRYTAKVLEMLLKELKAQFPGIRFGVLFGTSGFALGNDRMTFKEQTYTLHKFRKGDLNCLIATAVAEEGLDIPDCNLVIRFDLYSTMIQYIQSRGRARHSSSKYIHMAEQGNARHLQLIKDVKDAERAMKHFCSILPSERLLDMPVGPAVIPEEDESYQITIKNTGAKLTLSSSMQILGHFVDKLFCDGNSQFRPIYYTQPVFGRGYRCEIMLPEQSPVTNVEGPPRASKSASKQAAAFEAVKILLEKKYLDDRLLPTVKEKIRPLMANAHLAVDLFKVNSYKSKVKAPFWDMQEDERPNELHFTCFYVKQDENQPFGVDNFQPLLLVTRKRLPEFPNIPLISDRGDNLIAENVQLRQVVVDPPEELIFKINRFTDKFFIDVFNKVFDIRTEKMPYWVLPLKYEITFKEELTIEEIVEWDLVHDCQKQDWVPWDSSMPDDVCANRFLIDKGQGSRRFFTQKIEAGMGIYTPVPEGACTAPFVANIIDYSFSAGKKGWAKWKDQVPEKQPVLRSNRVLHRINWLDPPSEREQNQQTLAFVCPSPFNISNLPIPFVKMGLIFPSISSRLEGYLHAWHVCNLLGVDMSLDLALEAITKDSENTSEHGEDQVNKQRGMAANYERLEFLGDCFLKMGTTIALYSQHPEDDEFEYHVKRMLLICNKNLFERAKEMKLYRYIQTEGFSRRLWYPAIQMLKGKGHTGGQNLVTMKTHRLGDKTIADVCEALIGAALEDKGFDMATRLITNLLRSELHQIHDFKDYYNHYDVPDYQSAPASASQDELATQVEKETGYKFKFPRILRSAFTHPSVPNIWEKIPCYQRLEFLGDALIDQACVNYLWRKYPGKDPQWLTEHKMSMINNKFQGMLSVKLGFHKHIRYIGGHMDVAIRDYVTLYNEAQTIASDQIVDFWTDLKAPPKVLPDVLEAYLGATFVDSQFNFKVIEDFFDKFVLPYFTDMSVFDNHASNHPVTQLTAKFTTLGCDDWKIFCKDIKDRDGQRVISACFVHRDVLAEGLASTIKNARVDVAVKAIKRLEEMSEKEFLKICNCSARREQEKAQRDKQKAIAKATLQVSRKAASAAARTLESAKNGSQKENKKPGKAVNGADRFAKAPTGDKPKNVEPLVAVH